METIDFDSFEGNFFLYQDEGKPHHNQDVTSQLWNSTNLLLNFPF